MQKGGGLIEKAKNAHNSLLATSELDIPTPNPNY